jgi:prolyl-tRNA synthetase
MRASQLFIPTLREDPGDAEAASHRLLVRGGFIRQLGAGLWTFLPLGWRVHQKVVQIVREEMDAIGGQEMLMPVVTPAELWQRTGRYDIPEVYKFEDRFGRPFILAMTHEETVTFHVSEIRSYRELPQILYHFQTKDRDEPRPRGGLLRVREFIMKDAYSFDRDEEGLDRSFRLHAHAYDRIFERCGLEFYAVEAESGMMGGSESKDYLAPAAAGANTLVKCEATTPPTSRSRAAFRARPSFRTASTRPTRSRHPVSRRSRRSPVSSAWTRRRPRRRCRS